MSLTNIACKIFFALLIIGQVIASEITVEWIAGDYFRYEAISLQKIAKWQKDDPLKYNIVMDEDISSFTAEDIKGGYFEAHPLLIAAGVGNDGAIEKLADIMDKQPNAQLIMYMIKNAITYGQTRCVLMIIRLIKEEKFPAVTDFYSSYFYDLIDSLEKFSDQRDVVMLTELLLDEGIMLVNGNKMPGCLPLHSGQPLKHAVYWCLNNSDNMRYDTVVNMIMVLAKHNPSLTIEQTCLLETISFESILDILVKAPTYKNQKPYISDEKCAEIIEILSVTSDFNKYAESAKKLAQENKRLLCEAALYLTPY